MSRNSPSVWQNRDFLWLISGRTVSQFGTAVTRFTIPWLLLLLTGSGADAGIAFAIGFVPYLLISLPAGVWADRYNRKAIMATADVCRLLLLLVLPLTHLWSGQMPILLLYVVQGGISLFSACFDAAYGACLPSILEQSQLPEGNAALQTGSSVSQIAGPILAGVLVTWLGAVDTLYVDATSYLFSIATLFFIRSRFTIESNAPQVATTSPPKKRSRLFHEVREGLQFMWQNRVIRLLSLFTMLVNLVGPGMDIALLIRMKNELHFASRWSGIIMAGLSVGMLLGSLTIRKANRRYSLSTLLTASTVLQVIPPFLLVMFKNPLALFCTQLIVGFLLVAWNIQTTTIRQTLVPNHLLGRCVSVTRLIAWVSIPLGSALAGAMSQWYGAQSFFLFAGLVLAVVSLLRFISTLTEGTKQYEKKRAL